MTRPYRQPDTDKLLIAIWREACQHIEINRSTATIARLLSTHLPLATVIVRRVILPQSCLETVAVGHVGPPPAPQPGRTECTPAQMKTFLAWCAHGTTLRRRNGRVPRDLPAMVPDDVRADVLIGPLAGTDAPAGVLILVARHNQTFQKEDERLPAALLEPLSAALENDLRLHEMAQLREAAEADRRALLAKLGRRAVTAPIVGTDAGLRPVMERVAMVAASDVPVLLFGETGTGKEVIARAIHSQSPRAGGPFIRVNCGAVPPELIDSQLFGHEKGSFTGATDTRKGWFERADGGTLFLDEIGDLPLAAQVRLLRVLQDGALERVGGQHVLHVDVRVVGATHRDLAAMVRAASFREDLWYRLAVFPIHIPPLRARTEDIGTLARHFAEKAATRFGLSLVMPTAEDVRLLMSYAWPGNVRELATVIDRAALLGNGYTLEIAKALGTSPSLQSDASFRPADAPRSWPPAHDTASLAQPGPASDGLSLEDTMRSCIEAALRACHGRIEGPFGAAARLQVNPHTLRSRMRRLNIDWKAYRR